MVYPNSYSGYTLIHFIVVIYKEKDYVIICMVGIGGGNVYHY